MVNVPGYEIQELLSWGAQGDVFLAHDRDGQRVALKVVTADRGDGDPDAMARLAREARLLAALDSPHVVKVREFVQNEQWSCLAMEFLAGQRLDAVVRERRGDPAAPVRDMGASTVRLPGADRAASSPTSAASTVAKVVPAAMQNPEHVGWALGIALQLAEGVATLHRNDLVHRDLKPQNVMLVGERAVLIDFGFARREGVTTLTQTGTAIGTLAYMSPEQFRGAAASPRGDVFALGATIHHCLLGFPPGDGDMHTLAAMAARRAPPDVRRRNPAVGADLARVVRRCLEPDARDRYPDAGAVLADLQRCQRGERVVHPFSPGRAWRHHGRRVLWAAAASLLLAGGAALLTGADPQSIANGILGDVVGGRVGTARGRWLDCPEDLRPAVLTTLNKQVTDVEQAADIARALRIGVLRLDKRERHQVALVPSRGVDSVAPAANDFVSTDVPRDLLVQPGRVWCFVMSTEPRYWWSAEDPRCLQLLLQIEPLAGEVPPRSLQALPTEGASRRPIPTVSLPAGSYPVMQGKDLVEVVIEQPLSIGVHEVDRTCLLEFRQRMSGFRKQHDQIDLWFRHPDEPPAATAALWAVWENSRTADVDAMPAQVDFWEAYRLAAFLGFRLPHRREWEAVACEGGRWLGAGRSKVVPAQLQRVDAVPEWDRTGRGVCFATSNASEWILDRDMILEGRVEGLRFPVVPFPMLENDVLTFFPLFAMGVPTDPTQDTKPKSSYRPHGLRLYRQRLPMR